MDDGTSLILVPRYDAFMRYASKLAEQGAGFVEIAGNRTVILVTLIAPRAAPPLPGENVLFEQPILTHPDEKRMAVVVPVASLAPFLNGLAVRGARLEHVYDY